MEDLNFPCNSPWHDGFTLEFFNNHIPTEQELETMFSFDPRIPYILKRANIKEQGENIPRFMHVDTCLIEEGREWVVQIRASMTYECLATTRMGSWFRRIIGENFFCYKRETYKNDVRYFRELNFKYVNIVYTFKLPYV